MDIAQIQVLIDAIESKRRYLGGENRDRDRCAALNFALMVHKFTTLRVYESSVSLAEQLAEMKRDLRFYKKVEIRAQKLEPSL